MRALTILIICLTRSFIMSLELNEKQPKYYYIIIDLFVLGLFIKILPIQIFLILAGLLTIHTILQYTLQDDLTSTFLLLKYIGYNIVGIYFGTQNVFLLQNTTFSSALVAINALSLLILFCIIVCILELHSFIFTQIYNIYFLILSGLTFNYLQAPQIVGGILLIYIILTIKTYNNEKFPLNINYNAIYVFSLAILNLAASLIKITSCV